MLCIDCSIFGSLLLFWSLNNLLISWTLNIVQIKYLISHFKIINWYYTFFCPIFWSYCFACSKYRWINLLKSLKIMLTVNRLIDSVQFSFSITYVIPYDRLILKRGLNNLKPYFECTLKVFFTRTLSVKKRFIIGNFHHVCISSNN